MDKDIELNLSKTEIEAIVKECLADLIRADMALLQYDVSERAIAHKLAEYLQRRFSNLNVDCEYNRNTINGNAAPKMVYMLDYKARKKMEQLSKPEELLAMSAYPDIIVHRRLENSSNLLVVEIKKKNSRIAHEHDFEKLKAFTENTEQNSYHFRYGVFLLLETGNDTPQAPELKWFVDGEEI